METYNPNAFAALSQEKQDRTINAALAVFAAHGYRKASVADVAKAAGISKAMVFTYFGTKAGLYEFLLKYVMRVTVDEVERAKPLMDAATDYFERYVLSAKIKLELMKVNRAIMDFAVSMYQERDGEVRPLIDAVLTDAYKIRDLFVTVDVDAGKFKDANDADKLNRIIKWLSAGCLNEWKQNDSQEEIIALFYECFDALKCRYYKEEYL